MDSRLKTIIESSENIVFFGGAGVSTESNIPDFRSEQGLYQAKQTYGVTPEEILSHTFFMKHTKTFFDYYRKNLIYPNAQPNQAHIALAELERMGRLRAVITQNIDGLHQKAGSKRVFELHGSVHRNYCMHCHAGYSLDNLLEKNYAIEGIPRCSKCGGIIKPDVVLYEEALDERCIEGAIEEIEKAEILIIGGTSLTVYPAASFVRYFHGKHLVLINMQETPYDYHADLVIHDKIGKVMKIE